MADHRVSTIIILSHSKVINLSLLTIITAVSLVSAVVEPGLVSGGPPSVSQIKGPYISGRLSDNHDGKKQHVQV